MTEETGASPTELPAGDFSSWLAGMQRALRGEQASDVPCGDCTACCTSSQFIHIRPDEADALAHIPGELLFPAPGLPDGHVVMGYGEHGHCPMFTDGECSIYEHRPETCRTYDCRVFPAAGVDPGVDGKPLIARQARRWRFTFATDIDRERRGAVEAAAAFIREHPDRAPRGVAPSNSTQLAVLAVETHDAFREGQES
jgi:hypothetical protein